MANTEIMSDGLRWKESIDGVEVTHMTKLSIQFEAGKIPRMVIERVQTKPASVTAADARVDISTICPMCRRELEHQRMEAENNAVPSRKGE